MARFLTIGAVSAAVAAAAGGLAASGEAAAECTPAGAHVVARGRLVRVYSSSTGAIAACLAGTGSRMTLMSPAKGRPAGSLVVMATAGSAVAYRLSSFGVDSGTVTLAVADVASRRVIRSLPAGRYVDAGILGSELPAKVVLASDGALGWVTATRGPRPPSGRPASTTYTIRAAPRTGAPRQLDRGPAIDPESLTLVGRTLHWRDAGAARSARLP